MLDAAGETERIVAFDLSSRGVVVRPLQGVGYSVIMDGIPRRVSADVIPVLVKIVVQIVIREVAVQLLELERVREGTVIVPLLVPYVDMLLEEHIVRVDQRGGIAEHDVEVAQRVGHVLIAYVPVGERVEIAQTAVLFHLDMVQNVRN